MKRSRRYQLSPYRLPADLADRIVTLTEARAVKRGKPVSVGDVMREVIVRGLA